MQALGVFIFLILTMDHSFALTVNSTNPELNSLIQQRFKKNKKSPLELKNEIKKYLNNHSYFSSSVSIDSSKKVVISRPFKWEVFFENNNNITDYELRQVLKDKDFEGAPTRFLNEVKTLISSKYQKKGYNFISVSPSNYKLSKDNRQRAIFKIDEGPKVKIDKIIFSNGSKKFSKKQLKKLLINYSGSPVSKGFFSISSLKSGMQSIKNDFNNQGYFRSHFNIDKISFNEKKDRATIFIDSKISSPTIITKINFTGNSKVSSFWLNLLLGFKKGEPINLYSLEQGLDTIKDYYSQRGFLEAKIEEDKILTYDTSLETVAINIAIEEKSQALVSDIKIQGLEKTKEYVVKKELEFKPGEVLTLAKFQNSLKNLRNLGIFSKVDIDYSKFDKDSLGRNLVVNLAEKKPGVFTTGVGISNERDLTYKVYAGLGYRNLSGKARSVSSRFELRLNNEEKGYLENRVLFSFLEPYFLNTKTNGRINFTGTNEIWDVDKSLDRVTIVKSLNLNAALEKKISKHFTLSWSVFDLSVRTEEEIKGRFDKIEEYIASTGPKLEIDYRNNPFLPSKGFFTKVNAEYADFGSDLENDGNLYDLKFFRFNALHTFYKEISPKLIFAQSFQGGYLRNLSDTPFFPKSRAFFLGGALSIRGFDPSRDSERIPNDDQLIISGQTGRVQGGGLLEIEGDSYYYLTKSEVRFPLFEKSNLWGAVFYDAGAVRIPFVEKNSANIGLDAIDKWRHTAGIGLRWNTPIGPLNLELGYKLDRKRSEDEKAFRFHISVGTF